MNKVKEFIKIVAVKASNMFFSVVEWIKFYLCNRFYLFISVQGSLLIANFYIGNGNTLIPDTDLSGLWLYSGLSTLLLSIIFIEPYYTSPKNVIVNTLSIALALVSVEEQFSHKILWHFSFWFIFSLLVISIVAVSLSDSINSSGSIKNKISSLLAKISTLFGRAKIIFSFTFFLFLYLNIIEYKFTVINQHHFMAIIAFWWLIMAIKPSSLHNFFRREKEKRSENDIGTVFGVQSRKMFLTNLFEDRKSIKKFDIVKFHYSMQDTDGYVITGIVFDTYLLNQQKWAKVLQLDLKKDNTKSVKNIVYKVTDDEEAQEIENRLKISEFVGVVSRGSTIGKIKFEYSKKKDDLQEGDLLELMYQKERLFYQVFGGFTEKERLEGRNETGYIEGEAVQLGKWDGESLSFQKFGWLPPINTPLFKADTSDDGGEESVTPYLDIGKIPGTKLPCIINLNDAVSHHMALLGVTGAGKSCLAAEIIKELKKCNIKTIIVDLNNEFSKTFGSELNSIAVGNNSGTQLSEGIKNFLDSDINDSAVSALNFPSLSNSVQELSQLKNFFSLLFDAIKERREKGEENKICIVLEEAHTIIPELNFMGINDWDAKATVNSVGQIALQGRKYGVGLMVISQRTATVSKTILTQCNTVVCFQAFDKTSTDFLENYIGSDLSKALPNLKQFHAVITGKAVKSNLPMIIDFTHPENE